MLIEFKKKNSNLTLTIKSFEFFYLVLFDKNELLTITLIHVKHINLKNLTAAPPDTPDTQLVNNAVTRNINK